MSESEFELDGKHYIAIRGDNCENCAMDDGDRCICAPQCEGLRRFDGVNVIFVEKQS